MKRIAAGALLLILCAPHLAWAQAGPIPTYSYTFEDAITGDNEFLTGGTHYWFVNDGADNYDVDEYERPTVQTYTAGINPDTAVYTSGGIAVDSQLASVLANNTTVSATGFSSPAYFGYLDITDGYYGYNSQYMYFATELFSTNKVGQDGVATSDFGESSYYHVRISGDPDGAGGLMLSGEAASDYDNGGYTAWNAQKVMAYLDTNRDVGGPGGILVVNEDGNPTSLNGFEDKVISDGQLASNTVLWTRYGTGPDGGPLVEFLLDYAAFNAAYPGYTLDPAELVSSYLAFDADRGLKANANYLWNDEYSFSEGGSPYFGIDLGNIYELDTLFVPVPGAVLLGLLGLGYAGWRLRRFS